MSKVPEPSQVSVLIPAAGSGERLGLGPKAAVMLHGRPVVDWVVDKARQLGDQVLVACAPGMAAPAGATRVDGGRTRQESVQRLVERATAPWVLLWDAASPFASLASVRRLLAAAAETGVAVSCVAAQVPWLELEGGRVRQAHPSGFAGGSQTPQVYARELLLSVLRRAAQEGWTAQSTLQLVLRAGHQVSALPGEKLNFKLTTPEDLVLAQALLKQLQS